jgi:flagellar biosynthesis protein FlhA
MAPASIGMTHTSDTPAFAGGAPPGGSARPRAGSLARAAFTPAAAAEMVVPLVVLSIVLAMVTPLPAFLMDLLIVVNITISVVILLVAMYILKPVEFSVFPAALLLMTLFRLGLNVSSARLILLNGNSGTAAAGNVIEAFGTFVVGGNYIVGVVIFLVLIAIQYVVINHGAVRISEVTARFTLDAMPGKQMSIDSDLNAGLIDEAEARTRRRQLAGEAEFYGAMDGASRFTQRDAVASILITAINIIAGFLIGVLQHGMDLKRALQTYTVLTIGDGLVTVMPALMISISGGLVVTRASAEARLGTEFRQQLFGKSQPLMLASGVLFVLAAFPGLPKIPFLLFGGGLGALAWRMRKSDAQAEKTAGAAAPAAARENLEALLKVEPLAVEVGLGLVRLVEGGAQSPLLKKIAAIRRQMASELGYLLPPVRVTDNLSLRAREYLILLKGVEVARYDLPQGCDLAINAGKASAPLDGLATREPAFGIPAVWIRPEQAEAARKAGYTVVDATSVLGTHLSEVIRRHAHEIFTRQDAKKLLDRVSEDNPKVVEDLVPKLVPLAFVERVLQNLLRERVSIRDAVSILEALGEAANMTKNQVLLTEYVRQAIRRMVTKPYLNANGDLAAYLVDPALEQIIERAVEHGEYASHLNLAPQAIRDVLDRIQRVTGVAESPVAAVAGPGARYFLRQLAEPTLSNVFFLSHNEIPPGVKVVSMGVIS